MACDQKVYRYPGRAVGVAIFLAFAVPVIGGFLVLMATAAGYAAGAWLGSDQAVSFTRQILTSKLSVLTGALIHGVLPALVSGIWLATRTYRNGGFGYIETALTVLGATILSVGGLMYLSDHNRVHADLSGLLAPIFVICLVLMLVPAALICRWLLGALGLNQGPQLHRGGS